MDSQTLWIDDEHESVKVSILSITPLFGPVVDLSALVLLGVVNVFQIPTLSKQFLLLM